MDGMLSSVDVSSCRVTTGGGEADGGGDGKGEGGGGGLCGAAAGTAGGSSGGGGDGDDEGGGDGDGGCGGGREGDPLSRMVTVMASESVTGFCVIAARLAKGSALLKVSVHFGATQPSAAASPSCTLLWSAAMLLALRATEPSKSRSIVLSTTVTAGGGVAGGSGEGGGVLGGLVGQAGKGPKLQKRQPCLPPALQPKPPNVSSHGVKHSGS